MIRFGTVDISAVGAAVFGVVSDADDRDFVYPMPNNGPIVVIPAKSKYVAVTRCPGSVFETVRGEAYEAANKAIDVHFGQGGSPRVIAHKHSPLSWRRRRSHVVLGLRPRSHGSHDSKT